MNYTIVNPSPNQRIAFDQNGNQFFISYSTVVAMKENGEYFRTSKKYSNTTTRHINRWLADRDAQHVEIISQYELDSATPCRLVEMLECERGESK